MASSKLYFHRQLPGRLWEHECGCDTLSFLVPACFLAQRGGMPCVPAQALWIHGHFELYPYFIILSFSHYICVLHCDIRLSGLFCDWDSIH